MKTDTQEKAIGPQSTMQQVLEAYPAAQRALFQRYHIGGCSSCGFEPSETLEDVLKGKNVLNVEEAIQFIMESQKLDANIHVSPPELEELLKKEDVKLLDVRTPDEHGLAHIEGDHLMTQESVHEIMEQWPKDSRIVLYCHHGQRSLDAASYLIGHGFTNVRSLRGGIDGWSLEVDPKVPRYRFE